MGAQHSTDRHNKKYSLVDYGAWVPLGLYDENDECDLKLVRELILSKKISPFYKGLSNPTQQCFRNEIIAKDTYSKPKHYSAFIKKYEKKVFDKIYSNSIECPLCFLFYPANINFARCCDQPICTECFVQLKKGPADSKKPTSSHIACPYCMTLDFGIIYQKPIAVIGKNNKVVSTTSGFCQNQLSKRKTTESDHPDVVLIDHVRKQDEGNLLTRANSLHSWFQTRPASPSLDRHLISLRIDTMSLQDIMVIDSIRQSLIDKEQTRFA